MLQRIPLLQKTVLYLLMVVIGIAYIIRIGLGSVFTRGATFGGGGTTFTFSAHGKLLNAVNRPLQKTN